MGQPPLRLFLTLKINSKFKKLNFPPVLCLEILFLHYFMSTRYVSTWPDRFLPRFIKFFEVRIQPRGEGWVWNPDRTSISSDCLIKVEICLSLLSYLQTGHWRTGWWWRQQLSHKSSLHEVQRNNSICGRGNIPHALQYNLLLNSFVKVILNSLFVAIFSTIIDFRTRS